MRGGSGTLRVGLRLTPVHGHTHTPDSFEAFILFSPSSVSVVSDTVNLSQFPPLIIIKKRKRLHSPLNTPTRLLLLPALQQTEAGLLRGFNLAVFMTPYVNKQRNQGRRQ